MKLIPDSLPTDTIECLQQMLEQAKAGELIGVAFVAIIKRRGYIANFAGEVSRNPTFARGMLRTLDDQLGQRIGGNHP